VTCVRCVGYREPHTLLPSVLSSRSSECRRFVMRRAARELQAPSPPLLPSRSSAEATAAILPRRIVHPREARKALQIQFKASAPATSNSNSIFSNPCNLSCCRSTSHTANRMTGKSVLMTPRGKDVTGKILTSHLHIVCMAVHMNGLLQ
jgi:hypothetical protein